MKKMMMTTAACLMAVVAFANKNDTAKDADTDVVPIVLNIGSLRPGGNTPVFKASDFKDLEKIDFTDITNIKLGTTLADMGEFDFSKADSDFCSLKIPREWSDGGKSEALRVTSLLVDRNTRVIKGAISDAYFVSANAGLYAVTNDIWKAVCKKRFSKFVKMPKDANTAKRQIINYWPSDDGKKYILLEIQYIVTMYGEMSVNTLLHFDGDQINTKPMCQK